MPKVLHVLTSRYAAQQHKSTGLKDHKPAAGGKASFPTLSTLWEDKDATVKNYADEIRGLTPVLKMHGDNTQVMHYTADLVTMAPPNFGVSSMRGGNDEEQAEEQQQNKDDDEDSEHVRWGWEETVS